MSCGKQSPCSIRAQLPRESIQCTKSGTSFVINAELVHSPRQVRANDALESGSQLHS